VEVGTLVDNAWSKLPHTDGVEVEIVGGEHLLNVDPHQLDLAVAGLLSNALKFRHPDREPLIAVRASADEAGVRLCVTDNGIGIVEEHQDRVFKMFTRLHLRRDYPGTGVGLALVKRVMQRHRGAVEVQSTGEGSTFTLVFPKLDRLT
jgi:signal transduction histidine kinase